MTVQESTTGLRLPYTGPMSGPFVSPRGRLAGRREEGGGGRPMGSTSEVFAEPGEGHGGWQAGRSSVSAAEAVAEAVPDSAGEATRGGRTPVPGRSGIPRMASRTARRGVQVARTDFSFGSGHSRFSRRHSRPNSQNTKDLLRAEAYARQRTRVFYEPYTHKNCLSKMSSPSTLSTSLNRFQCADY